eukprot:TRINITY_DN2690_c0_g1_i1.p1 TRINITY_DN2690_c0_g1~~TRINITY_DN2690_c0_g1_i1.p1  ORF type:complete len:138 (-),score=23.42 TRINITY_DN2690_c0_g1_i1:464-877(-)
MLVKCVACGWLSSACVVEVPVSSQPSSPVSSSRFLGNFSSFPVDIINHVVHYLEATTLCQLSQSRVYCICTGNTLWKALFTTAPSFDKVHRAWKMTTMTPLEIFSGNWKDLYGLAFKKAHVISSKKLGSQNSLAWSR